MMRRLRSRRELRRLRNDRIAANEASVPSRLDLMAGLVSA